MELAGEGAKVVTGVGWIQLLWAGGGGFLLGLWYFGALWWTARRVPGAAKPYLVLAVSFVVRMALLLCGLYFLTRGQPVLLAAALVTLWLSRQAVMSYVRRAL